MTRRAMSKRERERERESNIGKLKSQSNTRNKAPILSLSLSFSLSLSLSLSGSEGRFVRAAGVRLNENKPTSHIIHWGLGPRGPEALHLLLLLLVLLLLLLVLLFLQRNEPNERIQIEIINGFVSRAPDPGPEPRRNDNDSLMIVRGRWSSSSPSEIRFHLRREVGTDFVSADRKYKRHDDGTIGISRGSSNIVPSEISGARFPARPPNDPKKGTDSAGSTAFSKHRVVHHRLFSTSVSKCFRRIA